MSEQTHTATKVDLVEARRGRDWYREKYLTVLDQRNDLLGALRAAFATWFDKPSNIREIEPEWVSNARAAIEKAEK